MEAAISGAQGRSRLASIDVTRGAVMVLMALDHTRYFFTNSTFQPETLAQTNVWLFLTRWVTHLCAPAFFLLAGFGIFLYSSKLRDPARLSRYLATRGAVLVLLELTIVGYSWVFRPGYSFAGVIWCLGWSMLAMAVLTRLPRAVLLVFSTGTLALHNLLDGVAAPSSAWGLFLWRALYQAGPTPIPGLSDGYYVLFSIVPWLAMMVLGFALGFQYQRTLADRSRFFVRLGVICLVAFVFLRVTNLYGNPETLFISPTTSGQFALQGDVWKTVIDFINVEKYPPSLLFSLVTLGLIFVWLGASRVDRTDAELRPVSKVLVLFGRVPLVFYVLHLYVIHLLALLLGLATSQPVDWLLAGPSASDVRTPGFGFDLWVVWVMTLVATALLCAPCRWYDRYKSTHGHAWLKLI